MKKIVVKFIDELRESLNDKDIRIRITEPAVEYLAEQGYDSRMGARPLGRKIDELIRVPLSRRILFERLAHCDVAIDVRDGAVEFQINQHARPTVGPDGFIRVDADTNV